MSSVAKYVGIIVNFTRSEKETYLYLYELKFTAFPLRINFNARFETVTANKRAKIISGV